MSEPDYLKNFELFQLDVEAIKTSHSVELLSAGFKNRSLYHFCTTTKKLTPDLRLPFLVKRKILDAFALRLYGIDMQ